MASQYQYINLRCVRDQDPAYRWAFWPISKGIKRSRAERTPAALLPPPKHSSFNSRPNRPSHTSLNAMNNFGNGFYNNGFAGYAGNNNGANMNANNAFGNYAANNHNGGFGGHGPAGGFAQNDPRLPFGPIDPPAPHPLRAEDTFAPQAGPTPPRADPHLRAAQH
ncbi:hypothetical protein BD626DRAFT_230217 [Schizophyllum amplum]|uniref:Uncharacterized protein n=1 Tax=Schizophyllum amplum TaxID=97359 RepID=A0A550BWG2_9AGAR|nr:hypothetical protein BD626DRAFT_230217 [Auriculariopsis ampla]